jgi:transcriptional regulator with XRE-family HTH domain
MNKSKINLPHVKMIIAHSLAAGSSQRKIAEALNTSQPTISRIARQDDVLEMIQKEKKLFIKTAENILDKLRTDPLILNEFQKQIRKELLSFKWIF